MNPKSVAIIAVVAVVVAVISFGTFLMDSGDDLELRDYLIEGDWVEYYDESSDSATRYTIVGVESIDNYVVNVSDQYTLTAPYAYILMVVDSDDGEVEYLRSEKVDTFLGEIDCDIYGLEVMGSQFTYYVEPSTGLTLITEAVYVDGDSSRVVMTGTSVMDAVDQEFADIALGQPVAGSTFTHESMVDYTSGDNFITETYDITVTVESVNEDGTLNITDSEDPATVEEFVAGLLMTDDEIGASTLVGTKVVSTQWGLMECDVYVMPHVDSEGVSMGDRTFIVESSTGIVLTTWVEMHDVEFDGEVWEDYRSEFTLTDCSFILVAD